jgi:hypothetical protein
MDNKRVANELVKIAKILKAGNRYLSRTPLSRNSDGSFSVSLPGSLQRSDKTLYNAKIEDFFESEDLNQIIEETEREIAEDYNDFIEAVEARMGVLEHQVNKYIREVVLVSK